jgi:hypothetical protein
MTLCAGHENCDHFPYWHSTVQGYCVSLHGLMQNLLTKSFAVAMLLSAPCIASAYITFTFTGTATTGSYALGYTAGQSITIVYTLNDTFATTGNSSSYFTTDSIITWEDHSIANDTELFTDVSGTGLSGTWTRPSSSDDSPLSYISINTGNAMNLSASCNSGTTGLTANGRDITSIMISETFLGTAFDLGSTSLPDPTVYFSSYLGTYGVNTSAYSFNYISDGNYMCQLNITSMTIASSAAVPEPAACASFFGLSVLGCAAFIRRCKRVA